jgi:hypothetical protein
MSDITVIDNEYATLVYHSDAKIVHHTFHKPISGEKFREVLNTGLELFKQHRAGKWLSDDRGNSVLSEEDGTWGMTNWFPRVFEAGWKFWALVVPDDIQARLNLKQFIDTYFERGLRIMIFTDPDEAMKWLERQ